MWTFIKLNTRDGRMWQVQYDVKGSERFEVNLNTTYDGEGISGLLTGAEQA